MLSSQRLWPRSCSCCVAFMMPPVALSFLRLYLHRYRVMPIPISSDERVGLFWAPAAGLVHALQRRKSDSERFLAQSSPPIARRRARSDAISSSNSSASAAPARSMPISRCRRKTLLRAVQAGATETPAGGFAAAGSSTPTSTSSIIRSARTAQARHRSVQRQLGLLFQYAYAIVAVACLQFPSLTPPFWRAD